MRVIEANSNVMRRLYRRQTSGKKRVSETVRRILADVSANGDQAVLKYTKRFDDVRLNAKQLRVTERETSAAYQNIPQGFVHTLKTIIHNIQRFYARQIPKSWMMRSDDGAQLGERYMPLDRVGIYVPAGHAPLVSSVYMTVIPARIAGVREIVLTTPPQEGGWIDPHILVVADLLKVDHIFKIGGAQAIGAMAFGTKSIPQVDKIVGPGNEYVAEAKRQVFGWVDVDMVAGPSEVVVIASQHVNPEFIVADLEAQSEHRGGLSILITTSRTLANTVKSRVHGGYIVLVRNLRQAAEITNRLAPEHVHLMVKSPKTLLKEIRHAGAIFLGAYSPVALGDYVAGPSHVLPTGGTARFFSGLGVMDFIKRTHVISYTKKALEDASRSLEIIAGIEGLSKHWESVRVRLDS